jgi:hypothetical protein
MVEVDPSGAAGTARKRAMFHAMGSQTMPRNPALPPGGTSDTLRDMERIAFTRQPSRDPACDDAHSREGRARLYSRVLRPQGTDRPLAARPQSGRQRCAPSPSPGTGSGGLLPQRRGRYAWGVEGRRGAPTGRPPLDVLGRAALPAALRVASAWGEAAVLQRGGSRDAGVPVLGETPGRRLVWH